MSVEAALVYNTCGSTMTYKEDNTNKRSGMRQYRAEGERQSTIVAIINRRTAALSNSCALRYKKPYIWLPHGAPARARSYKLIVWLKAPPSSGAHGYLLQRSKFPHNQHVWSRKCQVGQLHTDRRSVTVTAEYCPVLIRHIPPISQTFTIARKFVSTAC